MSLQGAICTPFYPWVREQAFAMAGPDLVQTWARLGPDLARLGPDLARLGPDLGRQSAPTQSVLARPLCDRSALHRHDGAALRPGQRRGPAFNISQEAGWANLEPRQKSRPVRRSYPALLTARD